MILRTRLTLLDFKDAFKQLPVHESERRFLAGTVEVNGVPNWFVYNVVLFGAIAGPLLWGRVAALLMRASAAISRISRMTLQCYVDNPIQAFIGTQRERDTTFGVLVLFWLSLGFRLSWQKGARGNHVDWIGARIEFEREEGRVVAVMVTIRREKAGA